MDWRLRRRGWRLGRCMASEGTTPHPGPLLGRGGEGDDYFGVVTQGGCWRTATFGLAGLFRAVGPSRWLAGPLGVWAFEGEGRGRGNYFWLKGLRRKRSFGGFLPRDGHALRRDGRPEKAAARLDRGG